jgi:hypothetical protein
MLAFFLCEKPAFNGRRKNLLSKGLPPNTQENWGYCF